ncbi:MAG TPA: hypothetical protein PLE33_09010 [Candidatus Cloacimonas sp.]|nr:hypothetical protein [Candidatus Cloacimonas sp.]HPS61380.1 hypothetical protein [Candidatus Cloacimonas sp.]
MYGPMPYVLETAFYHIYQWYGWDFKSGHNIYWDSIVNKSCVDRNADASGESHNIDLNSIKNVSDFFPTLDDLYNCIDNIVSIQGYSKDLQNDLTAALKVRVGSLKCGAKGTMLNTKSGTSIEKLLNWPTVVELERIGDAQEKVFIMGLLLVSIYEYYIAKSNESIAKDNKAKVHLSHLLVIEEAHRLLENVQQVNNNEIADMKGKAIETFNNILSEIRAYGQGIVVADQIPTKISPDVIKNTNLKIIHRLFSFDDRNAVGDAIGLDQRQKKGLIHLNTGEAIVFQSSLQEAVKVRMDSKGLEKGNSIPISESIPLNTLDVVISTTAIYSELKKVFQNALVFDWSYSKLQEKLGIILSRFSIESEEKLIGQLVSNLVEWFAIKLRNNNSIPYSLLKENKLKNSCKQPEEAIDRIRSFIEENGHTIQFPASMLGIYVKALKYFIYVYTEDRKALSSFVTEIRNAHLDEFRFNNINTQSILMAVADIDKYFNTKELSESEINELCQCLVYFSSYTHTGFEYYFNQPNKQITDEEYLKYLKQSEEHKPETVLTTTTPLDPEIKQLLKLIADNLKKIGQKPVTDTEKKGGISLPIVLMLTNTLFIILAVLYMILR